MNPDNDSEDREKKSMAVARAVSSLAKKLGFDPSIVFEGAIRGASALMMEAGADAESVATMLEDSGSFIRTAGQDFASKLQ